MRRVSRDWSIFELCFRKNKTNSRLQCSKVKLAWRTNGRVLAVLLCCLGRFIVAGARSSGGERCKKETACRPGAKWETAAKNEPLVHNSSRFSSLTLFLRSRARRRRLPTQSVLDLRARCRVSLSTLSSHRQIDTIYCAVCHADSAKMTTSSAIGRSRLFAAPQ